MKLKLLILALFFCASLASAQQVCTRSLSGVNYVTASTYPFVSLDTVRLTNFNNSTGVSATLASGISNPEFGACAEFTVWNGGLGEVVITCAGCTISGAPSLRLESLQSADLFGDGQNYVAVLGGSQSDQLSYMNSPNGTTCNGLAKVDQTSGGKAVNTAAGDELAILGVVRSGCGTSGNSTIVTGGPIQVVFDTASINVGDAVGISLSQPATATDLGSASPTSGAVILGIITLAPNFTLPSGCTNAPGCWILLKPAGAGGIGGGGGSTNAVVTNPGATVTNSIQPITSTVQGLTAKCPVSAAGTLDCVQVLDNNGSQILGVQQNDTILLGKSGGTVSLASGTSSNTDFDGTLTMSSGTATYTFTGTYVSHPTCTASDETSIAAVKVAYTGIVSVTFTTSGSSDVIDYHCFGRN